MNAMSTYAVYNNSINKIVHNSIKFNPEDCIKIAIMMHDISPLINFSVQDVTSDYFTKEIFNTKVNHITE